MAYAHELTSPNAQNAGRLEARSELSGFARKRSGLNICASSQYLSLFWNEKMAACKFRLKRWCMAPEGRQQVVHG